MSFPKRTFRRQACTTDACKAMGWLGKKAGRFWKLLQGLLNQGTKRFFFARCKVLRTAPCALLVEMQPFLPGTRAELLPSCLVWQPRVTQELRGKVQNPLFQGFYRAKNPAKWCGPAGQAGMPRLKRVAWLHLLPRQLQRANGGATSRKHAETCKCLNRRTCGACMLCGHRR